MKKEKKYSFLLHSSILKTSSLKYLPTFSFSACVMVKDV